MLPHLVAYRSNPTVLLQLQVLDRDAVQMVVDEFEDVEIVDRESAALEDWARKTTDFVDEQVSAAWAAAHSDGAACAATWALSPAVWQHLLAHQAVLCHVHVDVLDVVM
jgi:hypothetical protein